MALSGCLSEMYLPQTILSVFVAGWPWGPRVNPPPHPLEVQYKKDNDRAGALLEEQAKLDQRRAQLKTLMQAVDDSVEVEEDVSQNLAKMVQATQELNSLLDRLEDLAEPQGMRQPPYLLCCPCHVQGVPFQCGCGNILQL